MEDKKVIVITGATSGLGKELVNLFVEDGCFSVFAGYRNPDKIDKSSNAVEYFYMDLTDEKSILEAAEYIKSKVSKIDILINAAGAVIAGPVEILDIAKLKEQFQVNTFSHIKFVQSLLPVLNNSRIINISSMASFGHFPFISPYCASKRSLDIFFNAFALENHKNIKIISVKPGVIATPIWEKSVKTNEETLSNISEYAKELEFLKKNALSNTQKGLDVKIAAKKIKKVALSRTVKSSYLIGKDAVFAQIMSYLPQGVVNSLVKFALKMRISAKERGVNIGRA